MIMVSKVLRVHLKMVNLMDYGLYGMKMDRNFSNSQSKKGNLMDFIIIGMKMDRRNLKELSRMVKMMEYILNGMKMVNYIDKGIIRVGKKLS